MFHERVPFDRFQIPRQVHVPTMVLLAASAFGPTPVVLDPIPLSTDCIVYWISYTRGAAGGQAMVRHWSGNGTEVALDLISNQAGFTTPTANAVGRLPLLSEELALPVSQGAGAELWSLPITVKAKTGVRLQLAEIGDPANPGTVTVWATGIGKG